MDTDTAWPSYLSVSSSSSVPLLYISNKVTYCKLILYQPFSLVSGPHCLLLFVLHAGGTCKLRNLEGHMKLIHWLISFFFLSLFSKFKCKHMRVTIYHDCVD